MSEARNALEYWSANRADGQSGSGSCAQAWDTSPLIGGSRHLSVSVLDGKKSLGPSPVKEKKIISKRTVHS